MCYFQMDFELCLFLVIQSEIQNSSWRFEMLRSINEQLLPSILLPCKIAFQALQIPLKIQISFFNFFAMTHGIKLVLKKKYALESGF